MSLLQPPICVEQADASRHCTAVEKVSPSLAVPHGDAAVVVDTLTDIAETQGVIIESARKVTQAEPRFTLHGGTYEVVGELKRLTTWTDTLHMPADCGTRATTR